MDKKEAYIVITDYSAEVLAQLSCKGTVNEILNLANFLIENIFNLPNEFNVNIEFDGNVDY